MESSGEPETRTTPTPTPIGVQFRIAHSQQDRRGAFELVHRAYLRAGLVEENPAGLRVTPYHFEPTTDLFVAVADGEVIATVTLVGDGRLGVPMGGVYPDEIARVRSMAGWFGEVSCLADRRSDFQRTLPVFLRLNRLMAQTAKARGMARLVIAVHPRHARFYRRFMGFQEIGEQREYPTVRNNPAVACMLDFAAIDRDHPPSWDAIFSEPVTAEETRPCPIPPGEVELFRPAAAYCSGFVAVS
jgi:hypothetical protein